MPLSLIVAAPAVAAVALLLWPGRDRRVVQGISLFGAAVSLAGSVWVAASYDRAAGGLQLVESYPVVGSLGISLTLAVDGWGVPLLLLTGLIIVTGVFASTSIRTREKDYFVLLLLLVAGVLGVFVSQDLVMLFLFYEIAVLPMYVLIGVWGTSHRVTLRGPFAFAGRLFDIGGKGYAAMKLTLMLLVGSAAILVAMLILWRGHGATTFDMGELARVRLPRDAQLVVFPLVWLGFGALAGVFPFHTWSPDGHASAPTAVSMLHAGVLMKLGAFGVMRVGMVLAPEGAAAWAPVVGTVAVINVLYGAFAAASQTDLKYIIAYSSVSHMGVVMLGAATLTPSGWNGAVFQMFAHGVMTGLFFALVGLIYERAHTRALARMGGFAHVMPGVAALFTLGGLSSLGLPGTAGFVAELLVFAGATKGAFPWWVVPGLLGAVVTAVYVLRACRQIFWGPPPAGELATLTDARAVEWVAPLTLGAGLVVFGVWPRLILDFIDVATVSWLGGMAR